MLIKAAVGPTGTPQARLHIFVKTLTEKNVRVYRLPLRLNHFNSMCVWVLHNAPGSLRVYGYREMDRFALLVTRPSASPRPHFLTTASRWQNCCNGFFGGGEASLTLIWHSSERATVTAHLLAAVAVFFFFYQWLLRPCVQCAVTHFSAPSHLSECGKVNHAHYGCFSCFHD